MSLNVHMQPANIVLRVHQPFVTRHRLLALQALKRDLVDHGVDAVAACSHEGTTTVWAGDRWAELEPFVPATRPVPAPDAYHWLFSAIGQVHRAFAATDLPVPRPLVATYASPATMQRWLPLAERAVGDDAAASAAFARIGELVRRLRAAWTPAANLPQQIVHGDARLGNFRIGEAGNAVIHDFGFTAHRPRVHELAYSLVYVIQGLGGHQKPERFNWTLTREVVDCYEKSAGSRLSGQERAALPAYMAAVPLYHAITAGFVLEPLPALRSALPFVSVSEWLLANPSAVGR